MTDGRFAEQLGQTFSERRRLHFHLSPPLLAGTDRRTGRPRKYRVPGWVGLPLFGMLAAMKRLRGTALDPFGRSDERRRERAAAAVYEAEIDRLVAGLTPDRHALALEIAALPLDVRGYGPVKAEAERAVAARRADCWARWDGMTAASGPAEARHLVP
jgi:indolepyruvate ferredoxin oxidoreductase